MGKIKKVATERHTATLSPFVEEFVKQASSTKTTPLHKLPQKLAEFPQQWPFPRGDLYHWIPLLDRFDHLLELFNKEYGLDDGPQTQPFVRRLLCKSDSDDEKPPEAGGPSEEELDAAGFSEEGDRDMVECVVHFTRVLHEHCGNRSLYASSGHINDLLNTASLSLVRVSLKLALRLAQRYQVARYKTSSSHAQSLLMANHYNFNLDNLQKIAMPFAKTSVAPPGSAVVTPGKGKEKAGQAQAFNPSDLVTLAKEPHTLASKGDIGAVNMIYYDQSASVAKQAPTPQPSEAVPSTPTPARRTSNLGPSRDRPSAGDRTDSTSDLALTPVKSREADAPASSAPKTFSITSTKVAETPAWALLREALPNVPTELRYEVLNRVRIAKALTSPEIPTQQLLEARLLAISNLSYSFGEAKFQEKIGIPDNEEPRRFHLAQQLCDLLQPATSGQVSLSLDTETTVIQTLEALLKSRHKIAEVIDALAITVNHGVLYYELRKVIATLHVDEHADGGHELRELEWREATFDLIHNLQVQHSQARVGEKMVAAGVMSIMVEVLSLRTTRAQRFHERVLGFFASFIHNLQNAMQTFATDKGFDILADLTQYEVETALQQAKDGKGLRDELKSKVVDYTMSYGQQSTLRQLLKFIVQMFDNSGGTHDRLLRNLVDTPQILGSLKTIILDWQTFGSNIWKEAVNIMSAFIHNEPTSYQVVGEAGLPRALLQTIVGHELPEEVPTDFTLSEADLPGDILFVNGEPQWPEINGVLPVDQNMVDIPSAFGAICLNENGMHLFQSSKALIKYFDIFVSPVHIKALVDDDTQNKGAYGIGAAFDELSRHQPRLKDQIVMVVGSMVKRVAALSRGLAEHKHNGAKLWTKKRDQPEYEVDGGTAAMAGASMADLERRRESGDEIIPASRTSALTSSEIPHAVDENSDALRFTTTCARFLEGFFHNGGHNGGMCTPFCEAGGAEAVMDLVTSPSNPVELPTFGVYKTFGNIMKLMCESKAHLVLPSILRRLQYNLVGISSITADGTSVSFTSYGDLSEQDHPWGGDGTTVLKCFSNVQILTDLLAKVLEPPKYTSRHSSQTNQLFTNLNFTEVYIELVDALSRLRGNCFWEELALLKACSPEFKEKSNPDPHQVRRIDVNGRVVLAFEKTVDEVRRNNGMAVPDQQPDDFAIKNTKVVRYLLHITPMTVTKLFHHLGQSLTPRRSNEVAVKQHAALVAERIAKGSLWELDLRKQAEPGVEAVAELEYVAMAVQPVTTSMTKSSFAMNDGSGSKEALTLVLHKFYLAGGFNKLNKYLQRFADVRSGVESEIPDSRLYVGASHGVNAILEFYATVVRQKTIVGAIQSSAIAVHDHRQADHFVPGQFVVEIRDVVLPAVSKLWYSPAIESMSETSVKGVIEIMRVILKSEGEDHAIKRAEGASRRVMAATPEFALKSTSGLDRVQSSSIDVRLAREAIYRCNNQVSTAREYASLRIPPRTAPRFPIPEGEASAEESGETEAPSSQRSVDMTDAEQEETDEVPELEEAPSSDSFPMTADLGSEDAHPSILDGLPADIGGQDLLAMVGSGRLQSILNLNNGGPPADASSAEPPAKDTRVSFVTVEDLEDKRRALRDALIDRCLEVLSAVPGVTFELADLIQAAVAKSGESANPRADIGSTLVSSLMSLQADEPSKEAGIKIAAYAHLVALILQDRDFFISTMDELKEYLDALVGWVQLKPDQKAEDAPWMEMVLLIIERMLAEDEQPVEMKWDPPPVHDPLKTLSEPELPEPVVSLEMRTTLFTAIIDVLPKVGKNASLALSVSRVLVMLTRRRELMSRMREKQSLGRLFLMIRQLAGLVSEKLHSSVMLVLRHLVEDDQMTRQIIQTEIRMAFEGHRSARAMDTSTYTRTLYHLVLRDPNLFIDVTKEMVEVGRFDGNPDRAQTLALKKDTPAEPASEEPAKQSADGDVQVEGVQSSVEGAAKAEEQGSFDAKAPATDSSDGVVSFLLRELSNYKDVEERPSVTTKDSQNGTQVNGGDEADVDMVDASAVPSSAPNGTPTPATETPKSTDKPVFKAEEHSIYIYRCYILQCLSELLSSYDRTKMEFINFSRKPETQPATPAKPRTGTLNYLLNTLIPVGSIEHKDDIAYRKKLSTSHWATLLVVSLCAKTPERTTRTPRGAEPQSEPNADLYFVRKFVLEHALRCFKEATIST
ncbi:E3 ubiquitin-protein ligase tom1, partial [Teratosphaeriaceae sp. CCFEE 6253]